MAEERKLFQVEKRIEPEYGRSRVEFTTYIVAPSLDAVKAYVRDHYGVSRYYSMDREEVKYEINELHFKEIPELRARRDYEDH